MLQWNPGTPTGKCCCFACRSWYISWASCSWPALSGSQTFSPSSCAFDSHIGNCMCSWHLTAVVWWSEDDNSWIHIKYSKSHMYTFHKMVIKFKLQRQTLLMDKPGFNRDWWGGINFHVLFWWCNVGSLSCMRFLPNNKQINIKFENKSKDNSPHIWNYPFYVVTWNVMICFQNSKFIMSFSTWSPCSSFDHLDAHRHPWVDVRNPGLQSAFAAIVWLG